MKNVRININNRALWQKEARLFMKWRKVAIALCVVLLVWFIGLFPLVYYKETCAIPKWAGWVYSGIFFGLLFVALLVTYKLMVHKQSWYEYKFGKKH